MRDKGHSEDSVGLSILMLFYAVVSLHHSALLLWAELCPPNSYVEFLTSSNSECDHIWRQVLKEVIKVK